VLQVLDGQQLLKALVAAIFSLLALCLTEYLQLHYVFFFVCHVDLGDQLVKRLVLKLDLIVLDANDSLV
jgi:hypothetical protein